jgi:hypothetical protein
MRKARSSPGQRARTGAPMMVQVPFQGGGANDGLFSPFSGNAGLGALLGAGIGAGGGYLCSQSQQARRYNTQGYANIGTARGDAVASRHPIDPARWQAAEWLGATSRDAGYSRRQRS